MIRKLLLLTAITILAATVSFEQENSEPWKPQQLLSPDTLANEINHPGKNPPIIINVGPAGSIKGSVEVGPTKEKENIEKLRQRVQNLSKDSRIVIYCGCCPFKDCPNIRPAFALLNSLGFTNHLLLSIPKNLKVDWIDHGYPMEP
jgi:thiosulfate/3-mercaptopyruvate sulfurtransferase